MRFALAALLFLHGVAAAAGLSLVVTPIAAPEWRLGIVVNLVIIAALVLGQRTGRLI